MLVCGAAACDTQIKVHCLGLSLKSLKFKFSKPGSSHLRALPLPQPPFSWACVFWLCAAAFLVRKPLSRAALRYENTARVVLGELLSSQLLEPEVREQSKTRNRYCTAGRLHGLDFSSRRVQWCRCFILPVASCEMLRGIGIGLRGYRTASQACSKLQSCYSRRRQGGELSLSSPIPVHNHIFAQRGCAPEYVGPSLQSQVLWASAQAPFLSHIRRVCR